MSPVIKVNGGPVAKLVHFLIAYFKKAVKIRIVNTLGDILWLMKFLILEIGR